MFTFPVTMLKKKYVRSVQSVSITIAAGQTTGTAPINPVGAKAFLVYQGQTMTDTSYNAAIDSAYVQLTSSILVTATRNTQDASKTVTIKCAIIDATDSLVKRVQQGTTTITAGVLATTPITACDPNTSAIFYLGQSSTGVAFGSCLSGVKITDATTVTDALNTSGTVTTGWNVVEFVPGILNQNVQQIVGTFTSALTVDPTTITSVVPANTMLAFGGQLLSTTGASYWATLTNATTLSFTRSATTATSRTIIVTVIEFKPGVLRQQQRGSISLANAATNTGPISPVINTANAFANYTGLLIAGGSANGSTILATLTKTSSSVFTADRTTTSANDTTVGFEAPDFA